MFALTGSAGIILQDDVPPVAAGIVFGVRRIFFGSEASGVERVHVENRPA
jgi:hypothetical protein